MPIERNKTYISTNHLVKVVEYKKSGIYYYNVYNRTTVHGFWRKHLTMVGKSILQSSGINLPEYLPAAGTIEQK